MTDREDEAEGATAARATAAAAAGDAHADAPLRGIALKVASVAVMTAMASCIKAVAGHVPPGEAVFFRSLLAIPPLLIWLAWQGDFPRGLGTRNPLGHIFRGMVGAAAMAMIFTAFGLLPLTEVVAITYAAPLFVTMFAAMFLGEQVRLYRLAAIGLGFVGVFLILSPRLQGIELAATAPTETLGAVLALFAAVLIGLAQVFVRGLVRTETVAATVFWFSVTCTGLALLTAPFGWVIPTGAELALLIAAGLLGGVGQILLTSAYRHAEAGLIAPFEYVSMILAVAVGWFVFAEAPTSVVLGGSALIALAGIGIIWRERQLGLKRGAARQAKGTPIGG
ncbi:MAG: DMT family transporter [Pseudomonadota bacterium]